MAVYRYPLPSRRYRPGRYAHRRRGGTGTVPPWLVITAGVIALAGAGAGTKAVTSHGHKAAPAAGNSAAAQVTAFARARVGKVPYAWGGTTDAGMDCSGLAQSAYASAGIAIGRTSQQQWASERHVTSPAAGDLVFFAGSDGTPSAPGHVGIVTDPRRHLMIDAFGAGTYVRQEGYGPAAAPGTGLGDVVGFTDPAPATVTAQAAGGTVALGRRLAAAYGWSAGSQWTCLYALWERESGWSATADTRVTGTGGDGPGSPVFAYGIAQARPATKYPLAARPPDLGGSADPTAQVRWGLADIAQVYGTPCGAWIHETAWNWY